MKWLSTSAAGHFLGARRAIRGCRLAALIVGLFCGGASVVQGVEPAREFLEALRQRGWDDLAADYLASMETSRLAPDEFRKSIGYELAISRMESALELQDVEVRQSRLRESGMTLEAFLASQPPPFDAANASLALGRIRLAVGRTQAALANRRGATSPDEKTLTEARQWMERAIEAFTSADTAYSALYKELPANDTSEETTKKRNELRRLLLEAKIMIPMARFELGQSFPPGDARGQELIKATADRFDEIKEDYRGWAVAQVALVRAGRCHLALGDPRRALSSLDEALWQLSEATADRDLRAEATRYYVEACLSDELKNYPEAIAKGTAFVEAFPNESDFTPDGLAVRYHLARAHFALAEQLRGGAEKRRNTTDARRLARIVAANRGEYQDAAREMVSRITGQDGQDATPGTFAAAAEAGNASRDLWMDAVRQLEKARQDAGVAAEDQASLEEQRIANRQSAIEQYRLALRLADAETAQEAANKVRYYLCYLYWDAEHFEEASILGGWLARFHPRDAISRKAAQVSLAAAQKLYESADPASRDWTMRRLREIASLILRHWPNQPEAHSALVVMIDALARRGNVEEAMAYLDEIPAESPARPEAELRAGQALWAAYLDAKRDPVNARISPEALTSLVDAAKGLLETSVRKVRETDPQSRLALAGIAALGQLHLEAGDVDAVLALLKDELQAPREGAALGAARLEIYKIALLACISASPPQLDRAREILAVLEAAVDQQPELREELARLYAALGQDVSQQIQFARNRGDLDAAKRLAGGLGLFLDRVAKDAPNADYATLAWIARAYYDLAVQEALPTAEQRNWFQQAANGYAKILEGAKRPDFGASESVLLAVRLRRAECLRRGGMAVEAWPLVLEILKQKATTLSVQVEAAYILQERGKSGDASLLRQAMLGAEPDDKGANLVWGWGKIGQVTAGRADFADTFFESRYNLAFCRVLLAEGNDANLAELQTARNTLLLLARTRGDLVESAWYGRFDELMKRIQRGLKEPAVGLQLPSAARPASQFASSNGSTQ